MRILICKRAFTVGHPRSLPPSASPPLSLGLLYIHAQVKSQQITIMPVWRARRFDLLIIDSPRDGPAYFHTVGVS